MTTIAITGVGGLIGRRLVDALSTRDDVTRLIGIDRAVPEGLTSAKLVVRAADVRDPDLTSTLRTADVLVHLAFRIDPMHDEDAMRSINVDGTRNVLTAAREAGVGHVVYLSSAVAYGAHSDNPVPLTEDSPIRGTPQLSYAEHKRDVEHWLDTWTDEAPSPTVAVLRSAIVLGPGVNNMVSRLLEAPRLTLVKGHKPPLQFVHLDDVVTAIVHAIDHRLVGPYNVSAEGWLSLDEVTAILGRRTVEVPEEVAYSSAERLWKLGIGEQPPGLVRHVMHPFVLDPSRLIATGWQPLASNRDALDAFAAEHRPYLAVAGVRTTKTVVASTALVLAGLAGLATVVGVRELLRYRRTRRDRRASGPAEVSREP